MNERRGIILVKKHGTYYIKQTTVQPCRLLYIKTNIALDAQFRRLVFIFMIVMLIKKKRNVKQFNL